MRKWKSVTRRSIDRADVCQPRPRELIGIAGQKWSSYSWMLDGARAPSWWSRAATGGSMDCQFLSRFACAVGALMGCGCAFASDPSPTVVAIAGDVDTLVIRAEGGETRSYVAGEALHGTTWRFIGVNRGDAILRSAQGYKGAPLEARLRVGEHLPPQTPGEATAAAAFTPAGDTK